MAEVRVAHLVDGLGVRTACLVNAWSRGLVHDVAGFGFLSPSPKATAKNPKPGIVNHQNSRIIGVTAHWIYCVAWKSLKILENS